jgi:hypothetical protein
MTCKCHSAAEHASRASAAVTSNSNYKIERLEKELKELKADITSFSVEDAEEIPPFLLLKVRYKHPGGVKQKGCTFDGLKILVFENVTLKEAIKWRSIDPHFRDADNLSGYPSQAPSPVARFPGTDKGWVCARTFVDAAIVKQSRGW